MFGIIIPDLFPIDLIQIFVPSVLYKIRITGFKAFNNKESFVEITIAGRINVDIRRIQDFAVRMIGNNLFILHRLHSNDLSNNRHLDFSRLHCLHTILDLRRNLFLITPWIRLGEFHCLLKHLHCLFVLDRNSLEHRFFTDNRPCFPDPGNLHNSCSFTDHSPYIIVNERDFVQFRIELPVYEKGILFRSFFVFKGLWGDGEYFVCSEEWF